MKEKSNHFRFIIGIKETYFMDHTGFLEYKYEPIFLLWKYLISFSHNKKLDVQEFLCNKYEQHK